MNSVETITAPRQMMRSVEAKSKPALTLKLVQGTEEFLSLEAEWESLTKGASSTIYQSFDWMSQWWLHLGGEPNTWLHAILFRDNQKLVGIAPLFLKHYYVLGVCVHRQLCFLGCGTAHSKSGGIFFDDGPSDYLDIIALPEYEEEVSLSFATHLERHSHEIDEVKAVNMAQDSCMMRVTIPHLVARGYDCHIRRADKYARYVVPASFEEYLRGCSINVRRRITQTRKTFHSGSVYTVSEVRSSEEYQKSCQDLISLHQERWNKAGYPGYFAELPYRRFLEELGQRLLRKGALWFKTGNINGSCITARLGFMYNGTLYDYLSGFDNESVAAKHRPSLAFLINMIEDAPSKQIGTVDLLRGDEPYKLDFTASFEHNSNATIAKPGNTITTRNVLYQFVLVYQLFGFLIGRELRLMGVQYRQHGFPRFLGQFVAFRGRRLFEKFESILPQFDKI